MAKAKRMLCLVLDSMQGRVFQTWQRYWRNAKYEKEMKVRKNMRYLCRAQEARVFRHWQAWVTLRRRVKCLFEDAVEKERTYVFKTWHANIVEAREARVAEQCCVRIQASWRGFYTKQSVRAKYVLRVNYLISHLSSK
jgi:hypothetical protein